MSIWKRVVAPTVLVCLLWVLVTVGTIYYTNRLDESQTRALNGNRDTIRAVDAMEEALWRLQAVALDAASRGGPSAEAPLAKNIKGGQNEFLRALTSADESASTEAEKALLARIRGEFALYAEHVARRLSPPWGRDAGPDETMRLAQAVSRSCQDLFELADRLMNQSFTSRDRMRAKVNAIRLGFLMAGLAVGILFGIWVARGLHRSISQISVTLRDAQGDLEQEVGRVEIGPAGVRVGLPALQEQVREVSGRIREVVEELQQARREAVRAERLAAVGELAAGVAHELRNPLTSIKLLVQTAARRQAQHGLEGKQLQVVEDEVGRMETIIRELLDFAKPAKLNRLRHDVRHTLRRALNLVAGRATQQGVEIVEEIADAPLVVDGDPEQLDQVFINLLLNGIESMPRGGRLTIKTEIAARPAGGAACRLCFLDEGHGIPAGVLVRLFEPFVTSKEKGIGLGLAISRRIVQQHGGLLTAANQPAGGAAFTVELPLLETALPAGAAGLHLQPGEDADARVAHAAGH